MKTCICTAVTLAVLTLVPGSAGAQAQDDPPAAITVTPYVSLGSPFSSRVGAAIAFPLTNQMSLEA